MRRGIQLITKSDKEKRFDVLEYVSVKRVRAPSRKTMRNTCFDIPEL